MKPIQVILVITICLLILLYALFFKSKTVNRLIFAVIFSTGILFVLLPDMTNRIANVFGVGRGADLLLYFSVVTFYVFFIYLYSKLRSIEVTQTGIIRREALKQAMNFKKEDQEN